MLIGFRNNLFFRGTCGPVAWLFYDCCFEFFDAWTTVPFSQGIGSEGATKVRASFLFSEWNHEILRTCFVPLVHMEPKKDNSDGFTGSSGLGNVPIPPEADLLL